MAAKRVLGVKPRVVVSPVFESDFTEDGPLAFWKQVLPEVRVDYTAENGKSRSLDFAGMIPDLLNAYNEKALDQTPFVLADADNKHTMDAERFRGEVVDLRKDADLPPKVRAAITAKDGEVKTGLWAKIAFANTKDAEAVLRNPRLGVSARIREGYERLVDKKPFKAAIVHVLGTLDPKVTGMGGWTPALDFSEYASGSVLDLSTAEYPEAAVAPKKKTGKSSTLDFATLTADDINADTFDPSGLTEDGVEQLSNEALVALLAKFADELDTEPGDEDGDDEDDQSDDGTEPGDDDEDDQSDDGSEPDGDQTPEAKLSNRQQAAIDLANAAARDAQDRANEALRRMAEAEWNAERQTYLAAGVPAHALDLAMPVLNRPDDMVIDLSNEDGEDVNVAKIVRGLLDAQKGTVDLSNETGHGGSITPDDDDPDADLLAAWEEQFPLV